jgi:hypothetical protein
MTSALDITQAVKPPRAVFLDFPLGHESGRPDEPELQRRILRDALWAFERIKHRGEIFRLPYVWDPEDRSWEETDYTAGYMPAIPSKEKADTMDRARGRAASR